MGTRFILGKGFGAENLDQYSFFQKFFILSDNSVNPVNWANRTVFYVC
ncbi:hypothetical protein Enr17x_27180 [Gimesia fumaroli]|uniref:Uncharacterized protein n=1 Tax=Gimesia fumaroli TaxID=2527976 RepID=A0A518IC53_9PLAN|nr:hypothetical protein Enr17x_27180 [Gimesia fumaroli]